jgi:hypothetical protein
MKMLTQPIIGSRVAAALTVVAVLAGCDLTVTNPGPVQSDFLTDKNAIPALVNGAGRNLAEAINWTSYTGAAVARELHPAGSTGSFGITVQQQNGKLQDDEIDTQWNLSQQARWTAEDAIKKVKNTLGETDFNKNKNAAQALLWAGFANRLLGENFCDGVIDGGAKQAYTVYLDRAEANFTDAIAVATAVADASLTNAAKSGRAAVRLDKGNLAGAASDANGIVNTFVYQMPYNSIDLDQSNRIYYAGGNQPYRAHTTWHTYYETYYTASNDPRVKWTNTGLVGDAAVGNLGRVPFYNQQKYTSRNSAINLSSGWEMRLIEGEAKLVAGDVPGAMLLINAHRVVLSLTPWTATTAEEAWVALKRERGIETWLEARRLGDLRRWTAASRPGATDQPAGFDTCFPISRGEKETNPNLR